MIFDNRKIYCDEVWRMTWTWSPRKWHVFGWHKMQFDGVILKALNLGPMSIHNDWIQVTHQEPD